MNTDSSRAAADSATTELHGTQRHWAVLGILLGTFLGNLDAAIANIAMPRHLARAEQLRLDDHMGRQRLSARHGDHGAAARGAGPIGSGCGACICAG
ncbi:MAG: hypothetical protein WDO56_15480 [Gammaproteobacteria bacterium]